MLTLRLIGMTAAALGDIARDLGISASTAQISFSIYFLGLALGPLVLAAISEMNGRRNVWLFANLWFILWNSLCPVGYNKGLMIAGRFFAATGACVGNTVRALSAIPKWSSPVVADTFHGRFWHL